MLLVLYLLLCSFLIRVLIVELLCAFYFCYYYKLSAKCLILQFTFNVYAVAFAVAGCVFRLFGKWLVALVVCSVLILGCCSMCWFVVCLCPLLGVCCDCLWLCVDCFVVIGLIPLLAFGLFVLEF